MIAGSKVRLCPKRLSDAARDYAWRTDPELARLDASSPLTVKFIQYLAKYTYQLGRSWRKKNEFAIDTLDGKHIGNCIYYNINDKGSEAEIGIMIGNRNYWDAGYGTDAIIALIDHIFRSTKLERIFLKTLHHNRRAQRCFSKCGFAVCGEIIKNGHTFLLMEMYRHRWQQIRNKNGQGETSHGKEK